MNRTDVLSHNGRAWDLRAQAGERFARAARPEQLNTQAAVEQGLQQLDPRGWYGPSVKSRDVLCLGAGGGRHGPLLAAAGARVTVVDISSEMLQLDASVAQCHGLRLSTLRTSIDDLSALGAESFDLVVQPVSTCYVPDVSRVYREVHRVLRPASVYVSQHKTPTNLQAGTTFGENGYGILVPYRSESPLAPAADSPFRELGMLEFVHSWEQLVGGLCRTGFALEDLVEVPRDRDGEVGSFEHRCRYIAPYVRMKARKLSSVLLGL